MGVRCTKWDIISFADERYRAGKRLRGGDPGGDVASNTEPPEVVVWRSDNGCYGLGQRVKEVAPRPTADPANSGGPQSTQTAHNRESRAQQIR